MKSRSRYYRRRRTFRVSRRRRRGAKRIRRYRVSRGGIRL